MKDYDSLDWAAISDRLYEAGDKLNRLEVEVNMLWIMLIVVTGCFVLLSGSL